MTKRPDVKKLKKIASEIRIEIVKMLACAGSGHTGGSLSAVKLLVGLYFYKFRCDPQKPLCDTRDIFVLSKDLQEHSFLHRYLHKEYNILLQFQIYFLSRLTTI